jgi:Protein of unknown function (DUF3551)
MRITIASLCTLIALISASAVQPAKADPYRWCALYGGRSGATNCYFVTHAQCMAALSGNGGFCNPNNFYDGRPVTTPEDSVRRSKRAGR